jgi:hypothetical protein
MRPDYTLGCPSHQRTEEQVGADDPEEIHHTRTDADDSCLDYPYKEHSGSFSRDRFAGVTLEVSQHFRVHAFDFS